nr:MAG TPA: hypothetical protein [Caudoviricetes sp.]
MAAIRVPGFLQPKFSAVQSADIRRTNSENTAQQQ